VISTVSAPCSRDLVAAEGKGLGVVTLYIKPRAADIRLDI
jgi:hypothetical protein